MDRKTQQFQNVSSSQIDIQNQCDSKKIPASYFVKTDLLILNFIWRGKRPRIINTILKKNNKVGGLMFWTSRLNIKLLESRHSGTGERIGKYNNRTEQRPEIDPHKYNPLISHKGAKADNRPKISF